jgi:hypothetical protein
MGGTSAYNNRPWQLAWAKAGDIFNEMPPARSAPCGISPKSREVGKTTATVKTDQLYQAPLQKNKERNTTTAPGLY